MVESCMYVLSFKIRTSQLAGRTALYKIWTGCIYCCQITELNIKKMLIVRSFKKAGCFLGYFRRWTVFFRQFRSGFFHFLFNLVGYFLLFMMWSTAFTALICFWDFDKFYEVMTRNVTLKLQIVCHFVIQQNVILLIFVSVHVIKYWKIPIQLEKWEKILRYYWTSKSIKNTKGNNFRLNRCSRFAEKGIWQRDRQ